MAMTLMRRVEAAAEKPDALPGAVRRKLRDHDATITPAQSPNGDRLSGSASRPRLSRAMHAVFEGSELLDAHWSARM
jgi:hypothetical protein